MPNVDCCLYPSPEDKKGREFIDVLAEEAKWDQSKVADFLTLNDMIVFNQIDKERALHLIARFEKMGVIGSIGPLEKSYQKKFRKFANGYKLNWNWFAAIFSWTWLIFKGLWAKIAVYSMIVWLVSEITPALLWEYFAWIFGFVYFGMFGSYDYYLKKTKGESFWPKVPYQKFKLIFWFIFTVFIGYAAIYPLIYTVQNVSRLEERKMEKYAFNHMVFSHVPSE